MCKKIVNIAVFYCVFSLALLYFGFKNYRLFVNENHIIKQSGAWDIDNEIIEIGKTQAITTSQLFWHKSLNIGSLTIHTAGGNITFHLGNFDEINNYVNHSLTGAGKNKDRDYGRPAEDMKALFNIF